ncbi:cold-shock protein [Corynebacterium uberis]|uniref:cold-shock protein n=1 Tax=Corynebacterium TaxID=1716 RepID=UPI001D0BBE9D|nr:MULTISPECIES: cold shock domain-containing protein [Corynebacterium]MCZ9308737.1 cold shock domain-containing protein [Corynebacterium sp. c6VSa_13]UDL72732.1 cold shock domain-containing protein [Corynebacterium uberis]UDL76392.1 cold shock domain-containing protein [Corynebacterium uberis]UDL78604.1 cold shock domain-containing protein [Corynebacterium uberis]UDL80884.1 cold shock domain-containing protein [Corynebacterium uberis]
MPVGTVKWYDPERGFGFASNPGSEDVYIGRQVLPKGVTELTSGQRVEFDFASGRRGPQALRVRIIDTPTIAGADTRGGRGRGVRGAGRATGPGGAQGARGGRHQHRYQPDELNSMISDLVSLMEVKVQPDLQRGRFPERKVGRQVAEILRALAKELDA